MDDSSARQQTKTKKYPSIIRASVGIILYLLIAWVIYTHWPQIKTTFSTLNSDNWPLIGLAIIAEAGYFIASSRSYTQAFSTLKVQASPRVVLPVLLAGQTLGVVMPNETLAGQALFFSYARRHNQPVAKTSAGTALGQLAELLSFSLVFLFVFGYLFVFSHLSNSQIVAGSILATFVLLILIVVGLFYFYPQLPTPLIRIGQKIVNWGGRLLGKPSLISNQAVEQIAYEISTAILEIKGDGRSVVIVIAWALLAHLFRVVGLIFVLLALGHPLPLRDVITVYSAGTLVWIVSPVPQGIGLVEGAYGLALVSFGVPIAAATAVALLYRGIIFWLPFIIGAFFLRVLHFRREDLSFKTQNPEP